jgi:hypothetical protein
MRNQTQIQSIYWQDVKVEISYTPDWSGLSKSPYREEGMTHIEIRSIEPKNAPLPITETGYRSEFINDSCIDGIEGAVEHFVDRLDDEARLPDWKAYVESQRQYALF